ncbi:CvpA family protein [Acholeplasma vituli]|uniref:CvpA family protein n=1 Tax=Paracholeplasma vituli TaxID=69473 RepID=A0ABT2PUN0_9MOLU|nr:CvpA family protein [Paracholeplasma vituli]MCU0104637.1 CvpA family protein [Paracholeplasma vituli]
MAFTAAEMLQYLNYGALGIIGLAMFWGFIQGFYKSTFFFIWTVGILVAGFFLIPIAASLMMDLDISMAAQYVTLEGVTFTTVKETMVNYIVSFQPNLANVLVEGSDAMALVLGVAQLAISLVLFIVLFILNLTIFKFVGWIIWLIIKPKRGKDGKKRKKTFVSRLLGAGVGGLRGAFSVLLIALPFAALVSLSSGLDLVDSLDQEPPSYQLMVINDELVLVEVQQPTATNNEYLDMARTILGEYRNTYMGQIAGYVKIDGIELDTYVFDSILSIRVKSEDLDTQVKLRSEIEKALTIVNLLVEANDGSTNFGDDFIYKLTPEVAGEVFDLVTELDILEVVIPIGLEYLINSGDFTEMLTGYEDLLTLEDLKAIDYMADLGILGDVFVNALTLVQDQAVPLDQLNYFQFDGETVTDIFTSLGELDILEFGLPIGLNYLIQSEAVQQVYTDLGITSDDVTYPNTDDLKADFANIANVYIAIQDMGFDSMDDFDTLTDPEVMAAIPDQAIADLFDAIFGFTVISSNTNIASQLIYNLISESLPAEFQGLLTQADISSNFNATELTNLILLAKVVVSSGVLTIMDDENPDYATALSDENIESIVNRVSSSNLITSKMNDVITQLLSMLNLGVTLVIPPSINWAAESGQIELTALLKGAREILASNIISGDLSLLTEEMADNLAGYIADSLVIRYNLNTVFEKVLSSQEGLSDFEIALPETYEEWTETEINSLLKAAIILQSAGSDPDALLSFTVEQVKTIAKSKVLANTFRNVFQSMIDTGGDLEGQIYIPTGLVWYSTETIQGELESLLLALKVLIPGGSLTGADFSFDAIISADLDVLLASKVIEHTAVETLKPMIETGDLKDYIEPKLPGDVEYVWYQNTDVNYPDGDLKPLLQAIQDLDAKGISLTTFDYTAFNTALATEQDVTDVNNIMVSSRILVNSLDKMFTFILNSSAGFDVSLDNSSKPNYWEGTETVDGELIKLLRAVKVIGSGTVDANSITSTLLFDLLETDSEIVRMQISTAILGTTIEIPEAAKASPTEIKETELYALVEALDALGGSVDSVNSLDTTDFNATKLEALLDAGSIIVNRQISKAILGSSIAVPATAKDGEDDIKETELRALVAALTVLGGSVDAVSSLSTGDITATKLGQLLDAGSLIVNRQISTALIGSTLDIPSAALETPTDIKETELRNLIDALTVLGSSVDSVSSMSTADFTAAKLEDLLDAESLIVNRQISTTLIGSSLDIPDGALETTTDIYETELRKLVIALNVLGGSVDAISSLSANSITATTLDQLLDTGSLIVNRQISKAILASTIEVPAAAKETPEDIYVTELEKLVLAMNELGMTGSVTEVTSIDSGDLTSAKLSALITIDSIIVNRQISTVIIGTGLSIPTDAYVDVTHEDITKGELEALSDALNYIPGGIDGITNLTASTITGSMITNLLDAGSVIVNRQISSAIIGAGLTNGNTDAIEQAVGPRNGEVKVVEMEGLAAALTAMGPTKTVADLTSLDSSTVSTLDDATIDIMFDPDYTIIYYKLEAEMRNNPIYVMSLAATDYEGDNPANRIKRTKLAEDFKLGAI